MITTTEADLQKVIGGDTDATCAETVTRTGALTCKKSTSGERSESVTVVSALVRNVATSAELAVSATIDSTVP